MSKIKHPREKKRASLKRDHRIYAWDGNKSFRGVWRKKKARMARKARTQSRLALRRVQSVAEDGALRLTKKVRQLKKTRVVTLERHLQINKQTPRVRFSTFRYSSAQFTK